MEPLVSGVLRIEIPKEFLAVQRNNEASSELLSLDDQRSNDLNHPMQQFLKQTIESGRTDGYWIEAFPFKADGNLDAPDIVGYGLGTEKSDSKIKLFFNPYGGVNDGNKQDPSTAWRNEVIAELKFPVAMSYADISSNGFNDLIICDHYGSSMNNIWKDGGRVLWFENPGVRGNGQWKEHFVGKSAGMHRLKTGHFTRKDRIQIMAIPIIIKSGDLTSPTEVLIYTSPKHEDLTTSAGWDREVAFNSFRLVHEVVVLPGANSGLDQALIAGREGVNVLWYNTSSKKWISESVGEGLQEVAGNPRLKLRLGLFLMKKLEME